MSETIGTLLGAVILLSAVWSLELGALKDLGRGK
jgi:hypothetical protein